MGPWIPLLVIGAVFVVVVLWFVGSYNGLVAARNQVKNAWAQIDVQLKRRHDLIPNIVNTVKGYAKHESGTLERVIQARAAAVSAKGVGESALAEGALSAALGRLMAVVEGYPELKANTNFMALQEELASTENKIGFARQFYNDRVMAYNTRTESIPTNFVAGIGGFQKSEFFELKETAEREAPKVEF